MKPRHNHYRRHHEPESLSGAPIPAARLEQLLHGAPAPDAQKQEWPISAAAAEARALMEKARAQLEGRA